MSKKTTASSQLLTWLNDNGGYTLFQGSKSSDLLTGTAGNDLFVGLAGDDFFQGEAGDFDTVSYQAAKSVSVSLQDGKATGEGTDTLYSIEAVIGSAGSDRIAGDGQDNLLDGGAGNDHLTGNGGDDTLFGAAGNDHLQTAEGDDSLDGGAGNDQLLAGDGDNVLLAGDGNDKLVTGSGDDTLYGGAGNDNLASTGGDDVLYAGAGNDRLVSGNGNDLLYGEAGKDVLVGGSGNDTLDGGAGIDNLTGGEGNDTYYVDSLKDKVQESAGNGNDTVVASINYSLQKMTTIENLTLDEVSGSGNLTAVGNQLANVLTGNSAANLLDGAAGNDTLEGGAGADTLVGGAGADHFVFSSLDGKLDVVRDFTADDVLVLDASVFTRVAAGLFAGNLVSGSTAVAADANDYLLFNTGTGVLSWDADGSGAGAAVQIARLGVSSLSVSDFLIG